LLANDQVRIYRVKDRDGPRVVVACHRSNGRRTGIWYGAGLPDHLRLARRFLATASRNCNRYYCMASVYRRDVRSGRLRTLQLESGSWPPRAVDLELARDGSVAWITASGGNSPMDPPAIFTVRTADPSGRVSIHDESPAIASDSLALSGRYVYWIKDGVPASAGLR
jgi:hypothetical protein